MVTYYRIILKYIFIISAVSLALATFTLNSYHQENKAEVIISVNNLNSPEIMSSIEKDFNKRSGIKFIDGSDNDIQVSTLNKLLKDWGCTIQSISYRILGDIQ